MKTHSLQRKLLWRLMAVVFLIWAVGALVLSVRTVKHEEGSSDQWLKAVARQILVSTPQNLQTNPTQKTQVHALPADKAAPSGWDESPAKRFSYAIWARATESEPFKRVLTTPEFPSHQIQAVSKAGFYEEEVWLNAASPAALHDASRSTTTHPWRFFAATSANGLLHVQVGRDLSRLHTDMLHWLLASALLTLVFLALLVLVCGWTIRRSFTPVTRLGEALLSRTAVDTAPVNTQGQPSEIAPLLHAFNDLLVRIQAQMQLQHRWIADTAHELRTPLTVFILQIEVVQRHVADWKKEKSISAVEKEEVGLIDAALQQTHTAALRCSRLAGQLLDQARLEATLQSNGRFTSLELIALDRVTQLISADFAIQAQGRNQNLVIQADPCQIRAHLNELGVLLRNLIDNALRHSADGACITVCCRPSQDRKVLFEVSNTKGLISEYERDLIFKRFYRGRTLEGDSSFTSGSGLGLALVADAVQLHQAEITLEVNPASGTNTFTVLFRAA